MRVIHALRQLDSSMNTGLAHKKNRIALLNQSLEHAAPQVAHARSRLAAALARLDRAADRFMNQSQRRFERAHTQFETINPRAVLGRGYAIVYDETGRVQRDPAILQEGQALTVELEKGTQQVRVIPNRS